MIDDQGFWTWPVDPAAMQSRSRSWAIVSLFSYVTGAIALLLQTIYALPPLVAVTGITLITAGVAGSVGVLGKVLVTRHRLVH